MLCENLQRVEQKIRDACVRTGRSQEEVTLIAVSKTKPVEMLQEVYDAGAREFGENKPQELKEKYSQLPSDIKWHMIGHLQTNKIKYIIERACMIHSIDSFHLAEAVSKEAVKRNLVMPVLIEVNIAKEDTKFGIIPEEAEKLIQQISKLPGIQVRGLMTVAPYTDCPEENRHYFADLRKLFVDIKAKNIDNVDMRDLSMGMTGDYEIAIEEGTTMVRVGTGIFGTRIYGETQL